MSAIEPGSLDERPFVNQNDAMEADAVSDEDLRRICQLASQHLWFPTDVMDGEE
jgi:hypothetical protein